MQQATHRTAVAVAADIDAITAIARKNVESLGFLPRGGWVESIIKREVLVAVAREENRIVGFLQFHARRDRTVTIYKYAVDESCRGKGIGTLLLNCLVDLSKRSHWHAISLKVVEGTPACGFYESRGFAVTGREKASKRYVLTMRKNVWKIT
jgi:ribosomal protein S18 acetylase RimI-like enzyme